MKPYQILFFLFSVFLILFLVTILFPKEGIRVGKDINLKFVRIDDFIKDDTVKYADITRILVNFEADQELEESKDTLEIQIPPEVKIEQKDTLSIIVDSLQRLTYPIELSPLNPKVFYPIFTDLYYLRKTRKLIRLLHYGDSQIEADRITSFLRNKMQIMFGGSGCGLLPPVPLDNGLNSMNQGYSQNWKRFPGYLIQNKALGHKRYGALLCFSEQIASPFDTFSGRTSWLSYSPTKMGYRNSRKFSKVSMYLTNRTDTVSLNIRNQDSIIDSKILIPDPALTQLNWKFKETPKELVFSFEGKGRTEIYGISFDNTWGVAVDNIPLRGSSGLVFSKTDTTFLFNMYKKLNVGMLILQFGGNIVPLNADDYSFYEKYFRRELYVLKRLLPGIPVIVIGPSDMSFKENDSFVTYPNLTKVRDSMKNAAFSSGYAFWDMYEAMGGRNSMPSWVYADPPLAVPDFVHFNVRGTKIIGEMFYNAFLLEYNKWMKEKKSN